MTRLGSSPLCDASFCNRNRQGLGWYLLWLPVLAGCSNLLPETTPYGAVKGADAKRSLNGLAVHREMWEQAGAKTFTPQKLSPRLDTFDVIVLVGQGCSPPGIVARNWLEDWLSKASGRTVVYFGRDFSAKVHYHRKTLDSLPTDQRMRGQQALAEQQTTEVNLRIRELPEGTFCRWFYLDTSLAKREYTSFSGPWASDIQDQPGSWPVGVTLQPPLRKWQGQRPSWLPTKAKNANTALQSTATQSTASQKVEPTEDDETDVQSVQRSRWEFDELDTDELWRAEFRRAADSKILLRGDDDLPLVFRLRDDDKYPDSQILVVSNGAPFLNGSLVEPLHRVVASKLIQECLPAERVALLAFDERGLLITREPEVDARASGLEMLTVWPLSAITMPAALLGILICIVLLPVLGRPQSIPKRSVSDFGLHVDALGRMLFESRDLDFAKGAISSYYTTVRGEQPPYWLDSVAGGRASNKRQQTSTALVPPKIPPSTNPTTAAPTANLQTQPAEPPPVDLSSSQAESAPADDGSHSRNPKDSNEHQ